MKEIPIAEAKNSFARLVHQAEQGEPVHLTRRGKTVAVILSLMSGRNDYEFQCLQGMGRALYDSIVVPGN